MATDNSAQQGLLLIISGPSGVGKTTIAHQIEQQLNGVFSVSMTTRPQTPKDRAGVDYHFVSRQQFEQAIAAGDLLEWAQVFGQYYGTPRQPVEAALNQGRLAVLEIDVQGAIQVKKKIPRAFGLFILPPSEDSLLQRLRSRKRDSEQAIQKRFAAAKDEIARAKSCDAYDAFLVNDDLDRAIHESLDLVRAKLTQRQTATAP